MTRKDLLTLSPRLARQRLASHITLYLEPLQDTQSSPSESRYYMIRASCDLCPVRCEMSFTTLGRLSYAFADGIVEPFYSLCKRLDAAQADFDAPAGRKAATSVVNEEAK